MTSNDQVRCVCCGMQGPQARVFSKSGFDIFKCPGCGLGRAAAPEFRPEAYYTGAYFDGGHSDGYANYQGSEGVLKNEFRRTLSALGAMGKSGGRLLEIGCAYGFFLDVAAERFDVEGIEIAEDAVKACHARGLTTVVAGKASAELLGRVAPVDVVVLLDVIEHLEQPEQVLADAAARLKPGGLLMLTTGDWSSAVARLTGPDWRLMTPPQHLWYFTPAAVKGLARTIGLEVVEVTWPWKLVPLALILFQLKRMLSLGSKPINSAFASRIGLPVNLFDAMRVTLRKPA